MMYSAGNFITDSDENPFLQIGESKYGKPILDRILTRKTSLEDAARCAIVSMDSTIKSNATVGPPIEVLVYEKDTFEADHYIKMEEDDSYLRAIKQAWSEALVSAFAKLPLFHWEKRSVGPNLQAVTDHFKNSNNP
jgi:putative proteasome-type protease